MGQLTAQYVATNHLYMTIVNFLSEKCSPKDVSCHQAH